MVSETLLTGEGGKQQHPRAVVGFGAALLPAAVSATLSAVDLTDPTVRRVWGASLHKVLLRCHSPGTSGQSAWEAAGKREALHPRRMLEHLAALRLIRAGRPETANCAN